MTGENAMDESINVENKKQICQKPPLSVVRIVGEILAGPVTGFAIAFVSVFVVACVGEIAGFGEGCMDGLAFVAVMFFIIPPVYIIGCAIGVCFVGRTVNQTGSFWATLGGSLLGLFIILLPIPGNKGIVLGIFLLITSIMATIAFNLTRKYK